MADETATLHEAIERVLWKHLDETGFHSVDHIVLDLVEAITQVSSPQFDCGHEKDQSTCAYCAWERGHFYCAAEQGDQRCENPYRTTEELPTLPPTTSPGGES